MNPNSQTVSTPRTDAIVHDSTLSSYQFKRDMIALSRELERELDHAEKSAKYHAMKAAFAEPSGGPSDIVLATERGLTPIGECIAALQELMGMYTHAWDRVDGALVMMGSSVERFEAAHARAEKAIAAFAPYGLSATSES